MDFFSGVASYMLRAEYIASTAGVPSAFQAIGYGYFPVGRHVQHRRGKRLAAQAQIDSSALTHVAAAICG